MMHYQEFIEALERENCPDGIDTRLRALWYDAKGEWASAHEIVQQLDDAWAARIHAYLHRREGDEWNARYWHRCAGSEFPEGISLEEEWDSLVRELTDA